jgi:hypothetical protein
MIWALLAAYLTRRPPLVQSLVLGLCTGLFLDAIAKANDGDVAPSQVVPVVLGAAVISGAAFYAGLTYQRRNGWTHTHPAPGWLYSVYTIVWVLGLVAAIGSLLGAGGLKVAVLAIVPLVLLAPTAILGIRLALRRSPA